MTLPAHGQIYAANIDCSYLLTWHCCESVRPSVKPLLTPWWRSHGSQHRTKTLHKTWNIRFGFIYCSCWTFWRLFKVEHCRHTFTCAYTQYVQRHVVGLSPQFKLFPVCNLLHASCSLLEKIEQETWRETGISFVTSVTRLMERLLDYRYSKAFVFIGHKWFCGTLCSISHRKFGFVVVLLKCL